MSQQQFQIGDVVEGVVVHWRDGAGYGFLRVRGMTNDVFIPAQRLVDQAYTPRPGDWLRCALLADRRGRFFGASIEVIDALSHHTST